MKLERSEVAKGARTSSRGALQTRVGTGFYSQHVLPLSSNSCCNNNSAIHPVVVALFTSIEAVASGVCMCVHVCAHVCVLEVNTTGHISSMGLFASDERSESKSVGMR